MVRIHPGPQIGPEPARPAVTIPPPARSPHTPARRSRGSRPGEVITRSHCRHSPPPVWQTSPARCAEMDHSDRRTRHRRPRRHGNRRGYAKSVLVRRRGGRVRHKCAGQVLFYDHLHTIRNEAGEGGEPDGESHHHRLRRLRRTAQGGPEKRSTSRKAGDRMPDPGRRREEPDSAAPSSSGAGSWCEPKLDYP